MPPCLILSIIRYRSTVKWSNPRKGVVPFPTPLYISYWKEAFGSPSTRVTNFTNFWIIQKQTLLSQLALFNTPTASLQRSKTPPPTNALELSPKFDGVVPVILEFWGIRNAHWLSSLPCPLLLGVVAPDRVLSMGQIELNCKLLLNWIAWNRTVFK